MVQTENLNIESQESLSTPEELKRELPLTAAAADTVVAGRAAIEDILAQRDHRHLMLVGPCSIHNVQSALLYAKYLKAVADEVSDRILLVMRVYFEKPRTTVGWKGLIYDPDLNGSCKIEQGLRIARKILLQIAEIGLPAATEVLEPIIPQYITDLVCWAAIGARTSESQTHRQLASGLSMPIGFKNATDGSMRVAVEAIKTAASRHAFIGITGAGKVGLFRTRGNCYGHLVLRGGLSGPNYGSEHVAFARELMKKAGLDPNVVVDCSHANSGKRPEMQGVVLRDVMAQLRDGGHRIVGTMLESNLKGGCQDIPKDIGKVVPGISITDSCLGWEETDSLIREAYSSLSGII